MKNTDIIFKYRRHHPDIEYSFLDSDTTLFLFALKILLNIPICYGILAVWRKG